MEHMKIDIFLVVFLGSALAVSAVQDIRFQKIPNLVTYPTMGVALVYHSLLNGLDGFFFGLAGLGIGMAFFMIPYLMGGMGAGDVKLMGAVGAILGPRGVLIATVFTVMAGGIYALVVLIKNREYSKELIRRIATMLTTYFLTRQFDYTPAPDKEKQPKLCYGIAITLGTTLFIFLEVSGYEWII
jgi:prepilin peptidase CpaA